MTGNGPKSLPYRAGNLTVAVNFLPNHPCRAMATSLRKIPSYSLRCWVPTWTTRPVSLTTLPMIFPSSTVSAMGFST